MSKVKVKKMRMPVGGKDTDLSDMFNQMLGTGSVNMTIAYPKYQRIHSLCKDFTKVLSLINVSPFMKKFGDYAPQAAELMEFVNNANKQIEEIFSIDYSSYVWNFDVLSVTQRETFNTAYDAMKKSKLVEVMINTCDKLTPYKANFTDQLSHTFIMNMPGVEWIPLPFSSLNLKEIFCLPEVGENTIKFFMVVIQKIYQLTRKLWDEISSPDIDVDQFVDVIMTNIDFIQKRPELSRCKKAFGKIKASVGLLKDRFGNYYRDFIKTQESTIIFEHFILDVSKSTDVDPQEIAQFRTIIEYYRKIASQQSHNPQVKSLFDKVEESFKALEKSAPNISKEADTEPEPEQLPELIPVAPVKTDLDIKREISATKTVDQLVNEINSAGRKKKK
jgi:hypothetical protein